MPGPVLSERDLAVLRSFARRIDPSDAGAHNNLGVLYYQKGLIEDAIAEFVRALELDPRMQVAQANLDIAYRDSGHYDRRVTDLKERVRRHPEDREARWELARAHAALGRHAEAIAEFQALLAWQPNDVPAMLQLGLAEKARGNLDTAADWLARACAQDPASAVARFYHGEVLYNRGLNEPALEALRQAIERNPDYAEAHYLLAFVYGDMGRHDDARDATKRAIKLNPTLARAQANLALDRYTQNGASPAGHAAVRPQIVEGGALAHYNLGLAFRQKGLHEEALREYRLALDGGEDRRMTLQAMAEVHLLRRELAPALELYDALVREVADSPKLWNERGVCLHQAGRRVEAIASYEQAVGVDPGYQLAWNNLGVIRAGEAGEAGIAAFRRALDGERPLFAARLNLGLLFLQRHQLRPALEEYQGALAEQSGSAVAWNGVGLVLMELRRFEDARNAFGRAVDSDAGMAGAHYNLSFVLSQLGDFDGALRETRRALELEPLYVPQKFSLTIDLQYEDPTIAIAPELTAEVAGDQLGGEFAFDPPALDQLFAELAPEAPGPGAHTVAGDALDLARDYIAKGLLDLASAELSRAAARGAAQGATAVLLGDIFAKRGLYGEALERYRAARAADPDDPDATLGEIRALLSLGWAGDAAPLADELARRVRGDVEVLVARARVRLAVSDALGALDCIREAQTLAPGRPDLFHLQAQVSARLGDRTAALAAFNAALQLDPSLVRVWFELGGIEEERGNWPAARAAYERALDLLPTYGAAALALAELLRRTETPRAAIQVLVRLLEADPYELEALTALGRALLDDGRTTQALEAFERVLRFDPEHAGALYHEGAALARQRQFDQAVQAWERVVQLDPGGPYASQARSRARSARDLQHIFAASAG
ncbi:MAG TPA: tetratricopeptide repeat protein [Gemmatimonadales bacterium]|nr:tetratricopeptide repeat protein [Gemmatimonadales bacterium]